MNLCVFFNLTFAFPQFTRVKYKRKKMNKFPFLASSLAFCICVEVVHTCISLLLHWHLQMHHTCEPGFTLKFAVYRKRATKSLHLPNTF